MGLVSRTAITPKAQELMKRLFQFALSSALARAWTQRSKKWLSIAGAIVLFRALDGLAKRAGRQHSKKTTA